MSGQSLVSALGMAVALLGVPATLHAATVNIEMTGQVTRIDAAQFPAATDVSIGDSYSLSLAIEDTTPLSLLFNGNASYRQAVTGATLTLGGQSYGLAAQPFDINRPNVVTVADNQPVVRDTLGISVPLTGPDQGGLPVTHLSLSFAYGDLTLLDGNGLDQLIPFAASSPDDWGFETIQFRFRENIASRTAIITGDVASLRAGTPPDVTPVPLPPSAALLPLGLLGLGALARRRRPGRA